jgi:hypothetical protein
MISNKGMIENTDPKNEQSKETNENRRTVTRSGQVMKLVIRTNSMHFNLLYVERTIAIYDLF